MKQLTDEQIEEMARQEQLLLVCDDLEALTEIVRATERALAALDTAQPVQVNAMLVEDVNSEIVKRYKVEKTKGGFWPYCVKAGDGTMDLFIGSKRHAGHFQQALQSACLDGAFMAFTAAQQAQPERAPLSDAELEQEFCNITGLETGINPAAADTKRALVWFKKGYVHGIKQGGQ